MVFFFTLFNCQFNPFQVIEFILSEQLVLPPLNANRSAFSQHAPSAEEAERLRKRFPHHSIRRFTEGEDALLLTRVARLMRETGLGAAEMKLVFAVVHGYSRRNTPLKGI